MRGVECAIRPGDIGVEHWIRLHWFELSTLVLLCLNLWFITAVLNAMRENNRWLAFLSGLRWDEIRGPESPPRS
jgi:hypothetical protein